MDDCAALLARSAIAELIVRYALLNDAHDWEAVAALYTEDGRMSRPTAPDEFIVGRPAILASLKARPPRASRHVAVNIVVTPHEASAASATSNILLYVGAAATDGGLPSLSPGPPLIGSFRDRLVRTDAGWRFTERRGNLDFRPG
jgi:hypothetical protein